MKPTEPVSIPVGTCGDWAVERITVSGPDSGKHNLHEAIHSTARFIPPGEYTKLTHKGYLVMSDTPSELRDHRKFVHNAYGHILINGLGLGCAAQECLLKHNVTKVTVVELAEEVIRLVGVTLKKVYAHRLDIVRANAFEYMPPKGVRYGAVWHDIWNDICTDNLPEMTKLHRKYGHRCNWQGSWSRNLLKIDLDKVEKEKRLILEALRKTQEEEADEQ